MSSAGDAGARLRIGLGCTLLARGLRGGTGDGLSVYTRQLLQGLRAAQEPAVPVVFGREWGGALPQARVLPLAYPLSSALALAGLDPWASLRGQIDVFHAPDHLIPRLRGMPVVATVHDVIGLRHPEWVNPRLRWLKQQVFRRTVRWAALCVTSSEFSARDISEGLGIARERIHVVPLGVDEAFFAEVPAAQRAQVLARHRLPAGCFVVVGTLQPRKNVPRIIAAHASLPADLRAGHPLAVIGAGGWDVQSAQGALFDMEASGRGRWLRHVPREDLFALLQSAAALVYPSLYEGFGLPVLEGFASGIPVVTSNATSLPEVAGDAALLVDPLSTEQIAEAMRRAVEDTTLRAELVRRGLARAREFTWMRTVKCMLGAYTAAM